MLLAVCFFTSSLQHPVDSQNVNTTIEGFDNTSKRSTTYVQYSGPASNFPCISEFSEWQHLWERKSHLLRVASPNNPRIAHRMVLFLSLHQLANLDGV